MLNEWFPIAMYWRHSPDGIKEILCPACYIYAVNGSTYLLLFDGQVLTCKLHAAEEKIMLHVDIFSHWGTFYILAHHINALEYQIKYIYNLRNTHRKWNISRFMRILNEWIIIKHSKMWEINVNKKIQLTLNFKNYSNARDAEKTFHLCANAGRDVWQPTKSTPHFEKISKTISAFTIEGPTYRLR